MHPLSAHSPRRHSHAWKRSRDEVSRWERYRVTRKDRTKNVGSGHKKGANIDWRSVSSPPSDHDGRSRRPLCPRHTAASQPYALVPNPSIGSRAYQRREGDRAPSPFYDIFAPFLCGLYGVASIFPCVIRWTEFDAPLPPPTVPAARYGPDLSCRRRRWCCPDANCPVAPGWTEAVAGR
jgi:hypothetical protein